MDDDDAVSRGVNVELDGVGSAGERLSKRWERVFGEFRWSAAVADALERRLVAHGGILSRRLTLTAWEGWRLPVGIE